MRQNAGRGKNILKNANKFWGIHCESDGNRILYSALSKFLSRDFTWKSRQESLSWCQARSEADAGGPGRHYGESPHKLVFFYLFWSIFLTDNHITVPQLRKVRVIINQFPRFLQLMEIQRQLFFLFSKNHPIPIEVPPACAPFWDFFERTFHVFSANFHTGLPSLNGGVRTRHCRSCLTIVLFKKSGNFVAFPGPRSVYKILLRLLYLTEIDFTTTLHWVNRVFNTVMQFLYFGFKSANLGSCVSLFLCFFWGGQSQIMCQWL